MRLAGMEVSPRRIRLAAPYRISGRSFDHAEILLVTLRDDAGNAGHGAGSPVLHLTGDDFDDAATALEERIRPALVGADISDLETTLALATAAARGARGALAAVDIALHDLHARRRGIPLVVMLGGVRRRLHTSITVGLDEPGPMADAARRHVGRGFRILKIKIGDSVETDMLRLRAIREAVGPDIGLRVDANGGYALSDALEIAHCLVSLGVELFEQPVAASRGRDLREVARAGGAPVVADESVKVTADLPSLVEAGAAGGANIKLMKCGGIGEARRLDRELSRAGWRALVGCMDESRVSIAAAAHFAAAAQSVAWIDLDGHIDLSEDPYVGGFEIVAGEIILGGGPGLGVTPSP